MFAGPPNTNEDCLYLNVFTTRLGSGSGGSGGMAVLVWIHGGGNVDGESNDYDGSKLATGGPLGTPTVVVTINYRLNLLGFLAHPALDSEGHFFANYGILDQQAALHWVQRNIAAFGGDPPRVALGGQSAGAQAPYYFPRLPGFTPLAAHTIDIQFLFPNWHGGVLDFNHPATLTEEEQKLSDELVAAWTNFGSTGNPNGTGNSPWPLYTTHANAPAFLSENVPALSTFSNAQWSTNHNGAFWDSIIVYQP